MFSARKSAKLLLVVFCIALSNFTHAIGFGELKVYSYLGEPLYAEIELTGYEGIDPDLLQVNLADAKDFVRAGIDRPYFLTFMVFQIIKYDGKLYVVVRTARPVQTPYLEFLVEISWPGGNLIKEYTILLDPPPADLIADNRPKGVAQLAEDSSKAQQFGQSSIEQQLNMQKSQQQKEAAAVGLKDLVRQGNNKFSDETFDLPVQEAPQKKTLVPGVVPEVLEDEQQYSKQRAEFLKQQQDQETKEASETPLQKVVSDVEDAQTDLGSDLNTNQISAQETKTARDNATLPATKEEEPVNFGSVIKPAGGKSIPPAHEQIAKRAETTATATASTGTPLVQLPAQPPAKGNHMYLGMILSLLLIGAAIAIAIKRGLLTSILSKQAATTTTTAVPPLEYATSLSSEHEPDSDDVLVSEHTEDTLSKEIDEFTKQQESETETEHIELTDIPESSAIQQAAPMLTPVAPTPATNEVEKLEQEFENINLDDLGIPTTEEENKQDLKDEVKPEGEIKMEPAIKFEQAPKAPPDLKLATPAPEVPLPTPEPTPDEAPPQPFVEPSEPMSPPEFPETPQIEPQIPNNPEPTATTASEDVKGPTLYRQSETISSLKLSEEGASLVREEDHLAIDNAHIVANKIKLAKQYIETGDKDSAKDLLREVLEVANDEQKLEAQILLTSIV